MEKVMMWTLAERHKAVHQETIMRPEYSKPSRWWLSSNLSTGSVPTCSPDDSKCFVYSVVSNVGVLFLVSGYICKKYFWSVAIFARKAQDPTSFWSSVFPQTRILEHPFPFQELKVKMVLIWSISFTIIECWVSPIADL